MAAVYHVNKSAELTSRRFRSNIYCIIHHIYIYMYNIHVIILIFAYRHARASCHMYKRIRIAARHRQFNIINKYNMWDDIILRRLANNNYGFVHINIPPDYRKMSSRGRNYLAINENKIILTFFLSIYYTELQKITLYRHHCWD